MALSDNPALQAALAESRQQAQEATASLRQMAAHLSAERDKFKAESARRIEELQREARRGDLGPDQERLQRRVDAGETTWRDIANGADQDPSAEAARVGLDHNFTQLAEDLQLDDEFLDADEAAREQQRRAMPEH
jgi:hypothetical protein